QSAIQTEGWPASGLPRAGQLYDQNVQPAWQSGQKVAFFWLDAFRYDLALLLQGQLTGRHTVKIAPLCAQLPAWTPTGMAALLPGAELGLRIVNRDGQVSVSVNGETVSNPVDRFQLIQRLVGNDRCRLLDLADIPTVKPAELKPVQLLVV